MPAASIGGSTHWLVLVAQLPEEANARMRILRTLESLGCAILSDGAYILPETVVARQGLQRLGEHISNSGGSFHLLNTTADVAQSRTFTQLFDRSARYVDLTKNIESLRAGFGVSDPTTLSRSLIRLRREMESISALDFFPTETGKRTSVPRHGDIDEDLCREICKQLGILKM